MIVGGWLCVESFKAEMSTYLHGAREKRGTVTCDIIPNISFALV